MRSTRGLTAIPIMGIPFSPLGESEGEGMRRLLFALCAGIVPSAGCSLLASHPDDAQRAAIHDPPPPWIDSFMPSLEDQVSNPKDYAVHHK